MNEMKFYDFKTVDDSVLNRVVMVCKYKDKWVFCKHKERDTWEIPGGHIEEGENWQEAAKRELYEETGATKFEIKPICIYSISKYGILCYATVEEFTTLPESEIEKIEFFNNIPYNMTYPWHIKFFEKVRELLDKDIEKVK
ncbi:MAG TPA: NUDIX domain-containing protein [Bacilli bacterium]|nr:NUDIX domain-containing protein [Bacilli bacterium]